MARVACSRAKARSADRGLTCFFFQAEDGIRDLTVTGVQTCALPIYGHIEEEIGRIQPKVRYQEPPLLFRNVGAGRFEEVTAKAGADFARANVARGAEIGRASCRERV